eukprot:42737-Prorocentrum_minimum.AAC.1
MSLPPGVRVHCQGHEFTDRGTSSPLGVRVHRQGHELTARGKSSPPGTRAHRKGREFTARGVERAKEGLIQQHNLFTIQLSQLEDEVVEKLSASVGDALEDARLLSSLETIKATVKDIGRKQEQAKATEKEVSEFS